VCVLWFMFCFLGGLCSVGTHLGRLAAGRFQGGLLRVLELKKHEQSAEQIRGVLAFGCGPVLIVLCWCSCNTCDGVLYILLHLMLLVHGQQGGVMTTSSGRWDQARASTAAGWDGLCDSFQAGWVQSSRW
jgi:hypothetical protein